MIPLSRIIELSVVTAFYAGICYMLFDGACAFLRGAEGSVRRTHANPAPGRRDRLVSDLCVTACHTVRA
jgi:hypothetical protein